MKRKKKNIINNLIQQVMLLSSITELTNDQIKAWPTEVGYPVVPAPGENKLNHYISSHIEFNWAADYENIDENATIDFVIGGGFGHVTDSLMNNPDYAVYNLLASGKSTLTAPIPAVRPSNTVGSLSDAENSGIFIRMLNGLGDLTGGHPDNKLKITVYYIIVDL